ncbi:hypothetical protein AYO21_08732 [Fonsecaea monophora]|uniref:Uncharacterized protein n=2 Tax=Fonsecaea TaxID=40354 RepID=A0A178CKW8_9EURO|nr:hypothetical protein AYO20_08655 [Fonsecaea nubica]XP_022509036.1 hypothetical protein AYO21_08732 [Fonsecaea monophora]KAH0848938.1 hypothetical protein FOPE_03215 [Fonsecaea pedrosoi]OAG37084.1 hypothetical protein AYO21_08732 [Fonsecaea monophora]OAL30568.1 hypothetical protein AYO20_08655 [Fonsecaea nubica]
MDASNEVNPDAGWQPNGRPQSTIALDFSATLDDLFKLNGIGALEEAVVQKQDTVLSQRYELETLETKLREADEKLKRLEAKHRRQQSTVITKRKPVSANAFGLADNETEEDSSGDSDGQQGRSPSSARADGPGYNNSRT